MDRLHLYVGKEKCVDKCSKNPLLHKQFTKTKLSHPSISAIKNGYTKEKMRKGG